MTPQYTYDNNGNTIGVFLPIDDWNQLIKQFPHVDLRDPAQNNFFVPDWQIELGKKELQNLANATTELIDWSEVKKQIKL